VQSVEASRDQPLTELVLCFSTEFSTDMLKSFFKIALLHCWAHAKAAPQGGSHTQNVPHQDYPATSSSNF
jgi:hypothetical protein